MSQLFAQASSNAISVTVEMPTEVPSSVAPRMGQPDTKEAQSEAQHHQDARIDVSASKTELTGLDLSNARIRRFPEQLFRFSFISELRLEGNMIRNVPSAIGQMRHLKHLNLSQNLLEHLPSEIGKLTNLRELLLYGNQLTILPADLGFLYNLETLGLDGNPLIDPSLLPFIQPQNSIGVVPFLRDHALHLPHPPERLWHPIEPQTSIPINGKRKIFLVAGGFSLLSYNILADKYATPHMYGYVPSWCLPWEYRKGTILTEITTFEPDIICLQVGETFFRKLRRTSLSSFSDPV